MRPLETQASAHTTPAGGEPPTSTPTETKGRLRYVGKLMGEQTEVRRPAEPAPPASCAAASAPAHVEGGSRSSAASKEEWTAALIMVLVVTAAAAVAPAVDGGTKATAEREVVELSVMLTGRSVGVNLWGCAVRAAVLMTHESKTYAPVDVVEGSAMAGRTREWREGNVGGKRAGKAVMNVSEVRVMHAMSSKTAAYSASPASEAAATTGSKYSSHGKDSGTSQLGMLITFTFSTGKDGRGGHCAVRSLRGTQLTEVAHREEQGGIVGASGESGEELTELGLGAQGDLIAVGVDVRQRRGGLRNVEENLDTSSEIGPRREGVEDGNLGGAVEVRKLDVELGDRHRRNM